MNSRAIDGNNALVRRVQPVERTQKGCLTRTRRTNERDHLAAIDRNINAVEYLHRAKRLLKAFYLQNRRRSTVRRIGCHRGVLFKRTHWAVTLLSK